MSTVPSPSTPYFLATEGLVHISSVTTSNDYVGITAPMVCERSIPARNLTFSVHNAHPGPVTCMPCVANVGREIR